MRISDWSSDVCSSDLEGIAEKQGVVHGHLVAVRQQPRHQQRTAVAGAAGHEDAFNNPRHSFKPHRLDYAVSPMLYAERSEEHTSELQSLMRNSYAVFCLINKMTSPNVHL